MEVGLGREEGKTVWLTFMPIPTMLHLIFPAHKVFSIRIPQILRLPTYMSLGSLIFESMPCCSKNFTTDRAVIWLIATC
jgi:hypothetical protein